MEAEFVCRYKGGGGRRKRKGSKNGSATITENCLGKAEKIARGKWATAEAGVLWQAIAVNLERCQ